MFFIDLATGDIANSNGEKLSQPIHFTGFQKDDIEFSFISGTEPYILPENCGIVLLADIAEHYNTPMIAAFGTISAERSSAVFRIDTLTEEYFHRVKASNTPCFVDICLQDPANDFSKRLVRFNAIADRKLTLNTRPPEPLKKYYSKEQIDELLSAWEFDFAVAETTAIMLDYGEKPYADLSINRENNQYQLNFSIAIPAGKTGQAGYTPRRGVDYWTAADIAVIENYVENAILNGEW